MSRSMVLYTGETGMKMLNRELDRAHLASLLDMLKEFGDVSENEYEETKKMLHSNQDMVMAEAVIRYKAKEKMSLIFKEKGHVYESTDPNEAIEWTSVTSLVGKFKPKFDSIGISEKCSKNKKSKWYGLTPEKIRDIWAKENKRATDLGSFYHNAREADLMACETLTKEGFELPIIPPKIQDGIKYAPSQKLIPGIYPEHFAYLKSAGVCGQADYVEVVNGKINILDYKTNKEIKENGFTNWEGITSMLEGPLSHIEDCNLQHYTLQMSIYMYIMLKHNPKLRPGKLTLQHVVFEKEGDDEYGYPITKYNAEGDPIVKKIVTYEVPYLKEEVLTMINWLKEQK